MRATNQVSNLIAKQQPQATNTRTHTYWGEREWIWPQSGNDDDDNRGGDGDGDRDGQCKRTQNLHTHLANTQLTHTLLRHTLETEAINCEECEKIAEAVAFCASDTFDKGQPAGAAEGAAGGERREKKEHLLSSQLDRSPAEVQL